MFAQPKRISNSGKRKIELIFWNGLMPYPSVKIIVFMISGLAPEPAMMFKDVHGYENYPSKISISVGFKI